MNTEWQIEPFDKTKHDRRSFDCGVPLLNQWLQTQASQYHQKDLARSYVLIKNGQTRVCGYYAISSHSVVYEALPDEQSKGLPTISVPTLLIGRLAVDMEFHGQKLGEFLLLEAV